MPRHVPPLIADFLNATLSFRDAVSLAGGEFLIPVQVLSAEEGLSGFGIVGLKGDGADGVECSISSPIRTRGDFLPSTLAGDRSALLVIRGVGGEDNAFAMAGLFLKERLRLSWQQTD